MTTSKDDVWDESPSDAQQAPSSSPFDEPRTLDDLGRDSVEDPSDAVPAASKPNYLVMATAAAMALLVIGGFGFFLKSKLFPGEPPLSQGAPDLAQARANSVFDQPPPSTPSTPQSDAPPPAAQTRAEKPQVETAQAGAVASSAAAAPAASGVAPAASAASVTGAAAPATAPATAPAGVAKSAPAAPAKPSPKPTETKPRVQTAEAAERSKSPRRPDRASPSAKQAQSTSKAPAKQVAATEAPPVAAPGGLTVHAIFPLSGPDTQAWIRQPDGRTTIVRVGEFLAGARVNKIDAERGEVFTTAGVVTTHGQR